MGKFVVLLPDVPTYCVYCWYLLIHVHVSKKAKSYCSHEMRMPVAAELPLGDILISVNVSMFIITLKGKYVKGPTLFFNYW